jgi:hypothetical protein
MNYQELLAVTDKLPKYKTEDEDKSSFDENDECCICLEKDKLWKTSCNHIVCKNCIPQMKKNICPMCRKDIIKEINYFKKNKGKNFIESTDGFTFSDSFNYFFVDRNISIEHSVGREDENQRYSDRGFTSFGSIGELTYST